MGIRIAMALGQSEVAKPNNAVPAAGDLGVAAAAYDAAGCAVNSGSIARRTG